MVERRPGVMPPKPGPPPRQVSRRQIMRRRLVRARRRRARGARRVRAREDHGRQLVVAAATDDAGDRGAEAVPDRLPGGVHPRGDGAARRRSSRRSRRRKSTEAVRLSRRGYLAWSRPRAVPGFGSKKRKLEGFLFPATYDFLREHDVEAARRRSSSRRSRENWRKVDLAYARKKNLTPYDVLIIASLVEKEALAPDERPQIARRHLQPAARAA